MTFEITVNGKPYEMNIGFRELINDGRTSVSMDEEEQRAVFDEIRNMVIDTGLSALWLSQHNKNYTKEQYNRIVDLHCFLRHAEDGEFGDYEYRNENW